MQAIKKPLIIDRLETIDEETCFKPIDPHSPVSSNIMCPICYDFGEITTLECSHKICTTCLTKLKKLECPVCKAIIKNNKISKNKNYITCRIISNLICNNTTCNIVLFTILMFLIFMIANKNFTNTN